MYYKNLLAGQGFRGWNFHSGWSVPLPHGDPELPRPPRGQRPRVRHHLRQSVAKLCAERSRTGKNVGKNWSMDTFLFNILRSKLSKSRLSASNFSMLPRFLVSRLAHSTCLTVASVAPTVPRSPARP
jgi:hypothetical protein